MTASPNDKDGGAIINLRCGGIAIVSHEDLEKTNRHEWTLNKYGYVIRCSRASGEYNLLHRFVMQAKKGEHIHHDNEVKHDCRRTNLIPTTPSEHMRKYHPERIQKLIKANRRYENGGTCVHCGKNYTKHPDHRGRQTCCTKRCAMMHAVHVRFGKFHL